MAWKDGLDPKTAAYQIAADASKRVRVLAGPGTGKSYAIKCRITRLLEEHVDPKGILAITFTRMSAADLVRDIRSLGVAGSDDVRASTLHSECFRILGKNAVITITGRQIIVLCQSREYIRGLYEALQGAGVPSEFCYQESQFDEDGAKERMALLSLAGDQEDRVALRYLVGYGSNDWRTAQWAKIRAASVAEGKSPWVILTEMKVGTRPTTGVKAVFDRFDKIQTELAGFSGLTGKDLVNAWLPAGSPCTELRGLADSVAADDSDCNANALAEKVREIVTEPDIPDVVPDVRIMSLHKSKGLSANVVIIAGCVEGVMPRQRQDDMTDAEYAESIEEYRRLFFVGVTRVKAAPADGQPGHLIIAASRKVPTAIAMKGVAVAGWEGGMARTITSRFLSELGADAPVPVTS